MNKIVLRGMISATVATCAALPAAAVVESTDPDTGYKVLTVEAGEFAEYATVLDASVPGLAGRIERRVRQDGRAACPLQRDA